MTGGLLQLVGVGAQNELLNGNPSMTHFRAVYRRHTNFAMQHIRMAFSSSNLEFSPTGPRTLSARIDRYAQLLHDTYLSVTLPDIWSPLVPVGATAPPGYDPRSNSVGYEFQWIHNVGYNLIDHVDLVMNGQVIQRLRGEWLKMYSYLTHDANKRRIVDEMVGNVPQLYDPANAYDRQNQYPHAVTPTTRPAIDPQSADPEPSIRSRTLLIPLHFWFCENPGLALPLVSLQNSEVTIDVTLKGVNDLYTVIDVDSTSSTYGQRIKPTADAVTNALTLFLSPPTVTGAPSEPGLTTWFPDPYLEGNFIYLTEMEMNQLASADQTFLVKTVTYVGKEGQYGANTDIELPMRNMVTRIVFAGQRSDRLDVNDWDNYTNWETPDRAPWSAVSTNAQTALYASGQEQVSSIHPSDIVVDGLLLLDGKDRFQTKPLPFFKLLQMYRHTTGRLPDLPGVYQYSFALDNSTYQPSGAINASMFNKIVLRLSLQQPLPASVTTTAGATTTVCVLKSSVFSANPVIIPPGQINAVNANGIRLYNANDIVTVVQNPTNNVLFVYTYSLGIYVESINYLRIVSGTGNLVFAS